MFFLLTFGATTAESIRLGSGGNIHTNAPTAVAQIQLIMSLFFMFVTTAFVGNVVVRDDETGFGSIIRSTRIGKLPYMFGRFSRSEERRVGKECGDRMADEYERQK